MLIRRFKLGVCLGALALMGGQISRAAAEPEQDAKQIAYGRHLASECAACHRIDGTGNGIPSITGWRTADFAATMDFYRTGARPNQVMMSVVQSLDESQITALAAYYGSLPKPVRGK